MKKILIPKAFRLILLCCMFVICIFGLFGFMNGALTASGWAFWLSPKTELPLGDLSGIAVDSNGNIYCIANFYCRIQKYAPNGIFLKGWHSRDNNPRIRINEHDQLESADDNKTHNGDLPDTLATYDSEGNLLDKHVEDGCFDKFGTKCKKFCIAKSGDMYSIHNKLCWPHVIKTTPTGTKIKVIRTPWYLWLILGPFPAWIFFAIGLVCFWKVVDWTEAKH